ncbi:FAD-dependent monooxygenase [Mangrovicella endophytica]|uniref:FAD-dependent monooxygenase n=1 Tax=Mangrovicella endophytica TaxID=2066697 RepID=UPI000C9E68B8|nr:FAD-dependent monooxygenase [Mangrovicella endophytica]
MVDRTLSVAVAGAGIAGLSAALAFARCGFKVAVLERAAVLEEVGAGLQLSANALRALRAIGIDQADLRGAVPAETVTLRRARDNRRLARVDVKADDGTGYVSIHRADLQAALLTAVLTQPAITLELGTEIAGLRSGGGDQVTLALQQAESMSERPYGLVVAADGVRSRVAEALKLEPPHYSGSVAWRTMLDRAAGAPPFAPGITGWLGRSVNIVTYPVSGGERLNLVAVVREPQTTDFSSRDHAGRMPLMTRLHGATPVLTEMITRSGPVTRWPLMMVPGDRVWGNAEGRIILIGDAAHAMLPHAAQGAAMAIEDAVVAASAYAQAPDLAAAARRYAAERRPRIDRARRRAIFNGAVYHLPFPLSLGRDTVLSLRDSRSLGRDLAWLYEWQPPELRID